jgi:hypothetical protein
VTNPVLKSGPSAPDIDEGLVVNGSIRLSQTHPSLYRSIMLLSTGSILMGLNFWIFNPAFLVYDLPNQLWGSIFLTLGIAEIVFLNLYRRLRLVRATMAFSIAYFAIFGLGTAQPVFEGKASLQLPILYGGLVVLYLVLLLEPFINPWTARR